MIVKLLSRAFSQVDSANKDVSKEIRSDKCWCGILRDISSRRQCRRDTKLEHTVLIPIINKFIICRTCIYVKKLEASHCLHFALYQATAHRTFRRYFAGTSGATTQVSAWKKYHFALRKQKNQEQKNRKEFGKNVSAFFFAVFLNFQAQKKTYVRIKTHDTLGRTYTRRGRSFVRFRT